MNDRVVTELAIDANTSAVADYERAMASAAQSAQRGTDAANNFNINLVALGSGAVAAGFAIKKVLDEVAGANKELADMAALSQRVGLSLKDLQGVQFFGKIAGLTDQQINAGLEKSAELLNDAQRNVNSLSKQFEANGISIRNSNGQLINQNQLLQIAADMIKRAQSPQDAIAIAQMLGYTKEWVPFLRQGSDAMRGLGDEAQRAGAVIDDETVRRAEEFDRNWRRSSVEFSAYMKSALLGLLPFVDDLIERAARFVASIDRRKIEEHADKALGTIRDAGVPEQAGLKIDLSTEQIMADWQDGNKTFLERLDAIVRRLVDGVQLLSAEDVKFTAGTGESVPFAGRDLMNEGRWQAQADSWKKLSGDFLAGTEQIGAGFTKVASKGREADDAVDRALNSLRRHTDQQLANAESMGQAAAVQAMLRAEAAQTSAVQANQGKITAEQAAEFARLRLAAGAAAEALARARIASQTDFDRKALFLSPQDVQIAQQLRGIYGNDIPAALASSEAAAIRFNMQMRDLINLGMEVNRGLFVEFGQNLRNGMNAWDAFQKAGLSALGKIADKLAQMAADQLWKSAFGGSSGFGLGSLFGFGGGSSSIGTMQVGSQLFPTVGFHTGGIVGSEPTFERYVHPAYFDDAPRFHSGGIAGDEVPIIARRGEGVFTEGQMKAMGGGQPIQIIYAPVFNTQGADSKAVAQLAGIVAEDKKNFARNVKGIMAEQRRNNPGWS